MTPAYKELESEAKYGPWRYNFGANKVSSVRSDIDHEGFIGRVRGCCWGGSSATNNFEPKGITGKRESTNSGDEES